MQDANITDGTESERTESDGFETYQTVRRHLSAKRMQAFAAVLGFVVFWTIAALLTREEINSGEIEIQNELRVNVNAATRDELNLLPGVGKQLAADIVNYRDTVGEFQSVEDLANIRGIKDGRLRSLRKHLTVDK